MGLQDRDYNRTNPELGSDLGPELGESAPEKYAGFTVNNWLIIVNVAIYLIATLAGPLFPTPMVVRRYAYDDSKYTLVSDVYIQQNGLPVQPGEKLQFRGQYYQTIVEKGTGRKVYDGVGRLFPAAEVIVTNPIEAYGHFSTATGFGQLQVWRLVTFQFLHANLSHIFFNMFGLYIFGSLVEKHLGGKKYLAFYLVCGIFGGLMYLMLNLLGLVMLRTGGPLLPGFLISDAHTTLVGASAGVFGVIMACARVEPDEIVDIAFTPISLKMRFLAFAYVGIAAINLFLRTENAGGEAAHVGGALAGFYFILRPHLLTDFFDVFTDSRATPAAPPPAPAPPPSPIDAILAKIEREGMHSLSEEERAKLHETTEQMRRQRA